MKSLSARQFYFIVIISVISLKFMSLPSVLCSAVGQNAYFVILFALIIDFFLFWLLLEILIKNSNITFNKILENRCGKIIKIIFFTILGIYFFIKTANAIGGIYSFFKKNMFENITTIIFILPMFSFILYMTKKGLNTLGRTLEFIFWVIVSGVIMAVVLAFTAFDLTNIFPVLENGVVPILNALFKYSFWFGDSLILLLLIGRVKLDKGFRRNSLLIWLSSGLFVVLFMIIFVSVFGNMGTYHNLAISDMAQYSFSFSSSFKLDWLPILLWTCALFFQGALGAWFTTKSFVYALGEKFKNWLVFISVFGVAIFLLLIDFNTKTIIDYSTKYMSYYSIILVSITIVLGLICVPKRRQNVKNYKKNF